MAEIQFTDAVEIDGTLIVDGKGTMQEVDVSGGDLRLLRDAANAQMQISADAGYMRQIILQSDGSYRWTLGADAGAESGSNVGSEFVINRFADNGDYLDTPFYIQRQTGRIKCNQDTTVSGELRHEGSTLGLYGVTPTSRPTGYSSFSNLTTDRSCDADSTTVAELADILGTLIEDLKATGIIGA